MHPTLISDQDMVLVKIWNAKAKVPKPGQIAIVISPEDPKKLICKRVLAVEGEQIELVYDNKAVSWNDAVGNHRFMWFMDHNNMTSMYTVPKGYIWLQGDNCTMSRDSRQFGPVPVGLVKGIIIYKIWPRFNDLTQ